MWSCYFSYGSKNFPGLPNTLERGIAVSVALALLLAAWGCGDDVESPSSPGASAQTGQPALASAAAAASLSLRQLSGNGYHTCGVTAENVAYCWGLNAYGQLGDGTTVLNRATPLAVSGGLRFRHLSAGPSYTCGVTTDDRVYCWGKNGLGQLGDGTTSDRSTPVAVAGGRLFSRVEAGDAHACALAKADRRAYCWGNNQYGQLGDGTTTSRLTPTAVLGGLALRQVSAGGLHTCAVTPADQAFCWGSNRYGQLGDGTKVSQRLSPTLVAGTRAFRQVDVGRSHSCAVTAGYRAFCWGYGRGGEIGDGRTYLRFTPRAVAGGLSFIRVATGSFHTCGETTLKRAYCWGTNYAGQLGDGTTSTRLTPVPVRGGLTFNQLTGGEAHTCAVSTAGIAYCWGYNQYGQLGDGTTTDHPTPAPVSGPS